MTSKTDVAECGQRLSRHVSHWPAVGVRAATTGRHGWRQLTAWRLAGGTTRWLVPSVSLKACPHCHTKVRQSPNFAVVSPFSETVALFCDSVDRALRFGRNFRCNLSVWSL